MHIYMYICIYIYIYIQNTQNAFSCEYFENILFVAVSF